MRPSASKANSRVIDRPIGLDLFILLAVSQMCLSDTDSLFMCLPLRLWAIQGDAGRHWAIVDDFGRNRRHERHWRQIAASSFSGKCRLDALFVLDIIPSYAFYSLASLLVVLVDLQHSNRRAPSRLAGRKLKSKFQPAKIGKPIPSAFSLALSVYRVRSNSLSILSDATR